MTATSADLHFPEATGPVPIRFWWLKRLTVGLALLPVAVATLRLAWGWEAERRIRAADERWAERMRAAGVAEPAQRPIDDAHNAAALVLAAGAALNRYTWSPSNSSGDFPAAYTPYSPGWHSMAGASVAANGKALALARQARLHQRFDWGPSLPLNGDGGLYSRMNNTRALVNTLGDTAEYAHEMGDDVAALEAVRDVRHIATGLRGQSILLGDLVGVAVEDSALRRLHEIAPGLRIAPEGDPVALAGDTPAARTAAVAPVKPVAPPRRVTPANVRALIAELLDDDALNRQTAVAFAGERGLVGVMAEDPQDTRWLIRPMWRLDAPRADDLISGDMEAATQANWQAALDATRAARARLPAVPAPAMSVFWPAARPLNPVRRRPIDFPRLLSQDVSRGFGTGRAAEQNGRVATDRRLAAVGLAVQVYRAEHGRWPASMDELVPKYLPSVPIDPMTGNGSTLRYMLVRGGLPDGGDRPIAFSAGPDGAFSAANPPALPKEPMYSWLGGAGDQWRDLARWQLPAPTTAPSTQASDD
jgi:hypothetical protein